MYQKFCTALDRFATELARDYALRGPVRIELPAEFYEKLSLSLMSDPTFYYSVGKPRFPTDHIRMHSIIGKVEISKPRDIVTIMAKHSYDHWFRERNRVDIETIEKIERQKVSHLIAAELWKQELLQSEQEDDGYHRITTYCLDVVRKGKL